MSNLLSREELDALLGHVEPLDFEGKDDQVGVLESQQAWKIWHEKLALQLEKSLRSFCKDSCLVKLDQDKQGGAVVGPIYILGWRAPLQPVSMEWCLPQVLLDYWLFVMLGGRGTLAKNDQNLSLTRLDCSLLNRLWQGTEGFCRSVCEALNLELECYRLFERSAVVSDAVEETIPFIYQRGDDCFSFSLTYRGSGLSAFRDKIALYQSI